MAPVFLFGRFSSYFGFLCLVFSVSVISSCRFECRSLTYGLPVPTDNFLLPVGPIVGAGDTPLSHLQVVPVLVERLGKQENCDFAKAYMFTCPLFEMLEINCNIFKFEQLL